MKKFSMLLTLAAFIIGGTIFHSCQKEEIQQTPEMKVENMLKSDDCTVMPFHLDLPDCEEACLQDGQYKYGVNSWLRQRAAITDNTNDPLNIRTWDEENEVWIYTPVTQPYYRHNIYFVSKAWNTETEFNVEIESFYYSYDRNRDGQGKDASPYYLVGPVCSERPFTMIEIYIDGIEDPFVFNMDEPLTPDVYETAANYLAVIDLEDIFEEGWTKCETIDYTIVVWFGDENDGVFDPFEFSMNIDEDAEAELTYPLFEVCVLCEDVFASAYAGNTLGENIGEPGQGFNNAWWYAFDVEDGAQQSIWAEVDDLFEVIGTATLAEGLITLDLGTWYLREGDETVKYYVYEEGDLPTAGRPTPGHAPYKGIDLEITVLENIRYYVIHLDVETCR